MTTFDERENAYENKFARDAELEFLAQASRNKMIAYWAAEKMGMSAEEAAGYAKQIIRLDFVSPGTEEVVHRLMDDLGGRSTIEDIEKKMNEFLVQARRKVRGEDE